MTDDLSSSITGQPVSVDHPGIRIDIDITPDSPWSLDTDWASVIHDTINVIIAAEAISYTNTELSFVLLGDDEMQALNREHRDKNRPTNVLSFPGLAADEIPALYDEPIGQAVPIMLGDIVLSYQTIANEANAQNKPFLHHLKHLIVHGFLHLLGYDHIKENEAEEMEQKERYILKSMDIPDPYLERSTIEAGS